MTTLNAMVAGNRFLRSIPPDVLDRTARTAGFTNAELANERFMHAYLARDTRANHPSDPAASRAAANVLATIDLTGSHPPGWMGSVMVILGDALTDAELADGAFMTDLAAACRVVTYSDEVVLALNRTRIAHGYPAG